MSPCLRGTKIANPREQSQARLSYAEQEQFGQSQPKAEGVTPCSLLTIPYSLFLAPRSLFNHKGSKNISYITTFSQKIGIYPPVKFSNTKKGRSMLRPYYFIYNLNYSTIFLNKFFILTSAPMIACKSLIATRCCSIVSR